MKALFLLIPALVVSAPAHALSIVSLHGAPVAPGSVDMAILAGSVLALAAAIGLRAFRR